MRIKSFIAATVQEALKSVKREMGDSSIILETRNIEEGDIKSKAGQTLVEVIAAENSNGQSSNQNEEQKDEQELQDESDGLDLELPNQNLSDSSGPDLQQSEHYLSETEHKEIPEDHMDNADSSDYIQSDELSESTDSTPEESLGDFSVVAQSGKIKQVSKWIVDNKVESSTSHVDHEIDNNGNNNRLLSSAINQSDSAPLEWSPSEKYSSEKKQTSLPHGEEGSATLSDLLLAEDLIEIAGYSPDEVSATFEHQQNSDSNGDWPELSKKLFRQLLHQQVEEEHSRLLIEEAVCRLSKDEYGKMDLHSQMLRESIIHKIKISDSSSNNQDQCKTMAFVGAAGTGKTTTILKLASDMKKISDKEILLISIRGHSAERLKRTADRIGVALRTVTSHSELKDIIENRDGSSHIYIDTPGIGYRDDNALSGLKGFIDEIPNKETHLVVSAATRYADTINIVNKFTLFPIDRLHFTKVDETSLYGTIFSVAMETQIPLSCFSDGQEVPEDLRPVTAELIADMVLQV